MRRLGRAALALASAVWLTTEVGAVDLGPMGARERRTYCAAYVLMETEARKAAGVITPEQADSIEQRLATRIRQQSGINGARREYRRIREARDTIWREGTTREEVLAAGAYCRSYLRL
mgnify:CR=1 FL=1